MIEIEKKFILTEEQEKKLIAGAEFLGEKKIVDAYYDDSRYSLSTKDIWLRCRNGRFELKIPMNVALEKRVSDQYRELETDQEIAAYLNLDAGKPLVDAIRENGYAPFATIVTTRKKYKKDGYGIDLDSVDFGYDVAEIELMIDDESKIQETTLKIICYAGTYGLEGGVVRGKVSEYLRRKKPDHFQALVEAAVTSKTATQDS
jgi:adenylate cyclase class IV